MKDEYTKDKAIYVVSLVVVFFTLTQFKVELLHIVLAYTPSFILSAWLVLKILIISLVVSVYLYSLSYMYVNDEIDLMYKSVVFLADFFYNLALISPLIFFMNATIVTYEPGVVHEKYTYIPFILSGLTIICFSLAHTFKGKNSKLKK